MEQSRFRHGMNLWHKHPGSHMTRRPQFISHLSSLIVPLLALVAVTSNASAADVWTLMTGDLNATPVLLKSIDAKGVRVAATDGSGERLVPMEQFVEIERSLPPAPQSGGGKFILYTTTGDQLAGDPVGIKGDAI